MNSAERQTDKWYSSFRAAEPWEPTRLVYIRRCMKQGSSPIGVGTSIGAINASIIAGNEPPDRLTKLDEFWKRLRPNAWPFMPAWTGFSETWLEWSTLVG